MAFDIFLSIASKVADFWVVPTGRQIGYVINYNCNIANLKNQVKEMQMTKERIQHDVELAKQWGEEIESDVQNWLSGVEDITEETENFLEDEHNAKEKCFMGLCPNIKTRHQLSRKAKKKSQVLVEFQQKSKFDRISCTALSQGMGVTSLKDHEAFESRKTVLCEVLEALDDAGVDLVGVYGRAGVGKTTFVINLAREVREKNMFDIVVMATVTQTPSLTKIQGEIADGLGFKFDAETEKGRADRLCQRLQKEKKVLAILDDIWERIDHVEVGIPFGNDHGGCKILITSRNQDVLSRKMGAKEIFQLQVLPPNEAWNLFVKMVGGVVKDPNFQNVAAEIVGRCAGLPILLVIVASELRDGNLSEWKDTLQQLKRRVDNDELCES